MELLPRQVMQPDRLPHRFLLLRWRKLFRLPRPLRRFAVWLCRRPDRVRFTKLRRHRRFRLLRRPMLLVVPAFSAGSLSSIAVRSPGRAVSRLVRRAAARVSSPASSRIRALPASFRAVLGPSIPRAPVLHLPALEARVHVLGLVRVPDLVDLVLEALALPAAPRRLLVKRRALRDPRVRRVAVDASSIRRLKKAR
jgi:hypothetical protein